MSFDAAFWSDHYSVIYGALGVAAVLDTGAEYPVTVIEKSSVVRPSVNTFVSDLVAIHSAKAVAAIRVAELSDHALVRDDLNDAMLTYNGAMWRIKVTEPFPSPAGFDHGELYLILVNDD